jgi:hypothetical protein
MTGRRALGAAALIAALAVEPAATLAQSSPAPLPAPAAPRGTSLGADATGVTRTVTTRSLRDACDALLRQATGTAAVRAEPLRKVRTTEYCRLVSLDPRTDWLAVHLYRLGRDGKTTFAVIPRRQAPAPPAPPAAPAAPAAP